MDLLRGFLLVVFLQVVCSTSQTCHVAYNVKTLVQNNPPQNRTCDLCHQLTKLEQVLKTKPKNCKGEEVFRDCQAAYEGGERAGGVIKVRPDMSSPIEVYCDKSDGGWTVIQRRLTGHVSFNRDWAEYKNGFGNFYGDFWLGNERIYRLTSNADYKLRIKIQLFNGSWYHATYQHFRVENESDRYRVRVRDYAGNAGDVFINSGISYINGNNMQFSTPDIAGARCAKLYSSGWWFNDCMAGNLNGLYHNGPACPYRGLHSPRCLFWRIHDIFLKQALKATVMKIKLN